MLLKHVLLTQLFIQLTIFLVSQRMRVLYSAVTLITPLVTQMFFSRILLSLFSLAKIDLSLHILFTIFFNLTFFLHLFLISFTHSWNFHFKYVCILYLLNYYCCCCLYSAGIAAFPFAYIFFFQWFYHHLWSEKHCRPRVSQKVWLINSQCPLISV